MVKIYKERMSSYLRGHICFRKHKTDIDTINKLLRPDETNTKGDAHTAGAKDTGSEANMGFFLPDSKAFNTQCNIKLTNMSWKSSLH